MKLRSSLPIVVLALFAPACAEDPSADAVTSESELSALSRFRQEYVVGDLTPGAISAAIPVPGRGTYRAVRFAVTAAHTLDLQAWSEIDPKSGIATPEIALFDGLGNQVARSREHTGRFLARLQVPVDAGTYYLAFASSDDAGYAAFHVAADVTTKLEGDYQLAWTDITANAQLREISLRPSKLQIRSDGRCSGRILTDEGALGHARGDDFEGACVVQDQKLVITPDHARPYRKLEFQTVVGADRLDLAGHKSHLVLKRTTPASCVPKTCVELATCGHHVAAGCGAIVDCGECKGDELLPPVFDEVATVTLPLKYRFEGDSQVSATECAKRHTPNGQSPIAPDDRQKVTLNLRLRGSFAKPELAIVEDPDRLTHAIAFDRNEEKPRVDWTFRYWDPKSLGTYAGIDGYFETKDVGGTRMPTRTFVATRYDYVAPFASYDDFKRYHCTVTYVFGGEVKSVFSN